MKLSSCTIVTPKTTQRCIRNFTSFGSLNRNKLTGRPLTFTTQTNIDIAAQIIGDNNSVSMRHLSQQMGFRYSSTQTLVKKKLKFLRTKFMFPNKCNQEIIQEGHSSASGFFRNSTINILFEG